ncbi:MAG: hypothetical protein K6V73_06820 [Firmicutes bacterium]|nr:hypothetical protein [Bacillota bacterium]
MAADRPRSRRRAAVNEAIRLYDWGVDDLVRRFGAVSIDSSLGWEARGGWRRRVRGKGRGGGGR